MCRRERKKLSHLFVSEQASKKNFSDHIRYSKKLFFVFYCMHDTRQYSKFILHVVVRRSLEISAQSAREKDVNDDDDDDDNLHVMERIELGCTQTCEFIPCHTDIICII
jgi:hypothetical protein